MNRSELLAHLSDEIRKLVFCENNFKLQLHICKILEMSIRLKIVKSDKYYEKYDTKLNGVLNIPSNEDELITFYCIFPEAIDDIYEFIYKIISDPAFLFIYKLSTMPEDLSEVILLKSNTSTKEICENAIILGRMVIYDTEFKTKKKVEEVEEVEEEAGKEKLSPFLELSAN